MATIQVFGSAKCRNTQKALRFFKDRAVDVQFRDIRDKAPSPGELDDAAGALGGYEGLIDREGKAAVDRGLGYLSFDPRDELLRDPALLKTPLVRLGRGKASIGVDEKAWKAFAEEAKATKK